MTISYNIDNIVKILDSKNRITILRGAGTLGKLALIALNKLGIKVAYFWDTDLKKIGLKYCGINVVGEETILKIKEKLNVFVCSNYFSIILPELDKYKLKNIFDCYELIKKTEYSEIAFSTKQEIHNFGDIHDNFPFNQRPIEIDRQIDLHKTGLITQNSQNFKDHSENSKLNIKYIDLVITERCSMKCVDCSNLMQYYVNPKNSTLDDLFKSIEKVMMSIDYLSEFRVIGGEPFMNKDIGKILNFLKKFNNFGRIVIYTNATIIPKNENLDSLIDKRISLDITRYKSHKHSINNHPKLIEILNKNNINFISHTADKWTDSGRIKKYKRTDKNLKEIFLNCCVGDVLTILNGKMYRCPFSANAHNINAIPYNENDVIDILKENPEVFKDKLKKLYTRKERNEYLTACKFCKGRDFNTPEIPAGIQTNKILINPKYNIQH